MSKVKRNKLNELLAHWRAHAVMTSRYLTAKGYSLQLLKKYCNNGWLKRIGQGAYVKFNDAPSSHAAIEALQSQWGLSIHMASLTALNYFQLNHYVTLNEKQAVLYLFSDNPSLQKIPRWFFEAFPQAHYKQLHLFKTTAGLKQIQADGFTLTIAEPERAMLETLALVPSEISFEHASQLMEGLQLIRHEVMNTLLKECHSIKVKRLFLYLSEKHQLPCFNRLTVDVFDLGQGKRVIGSGGRYIAKYQLSVPVIESEDERGIGYV